MKNKNHCISFVLLAALMTALLSCGAKPDIIGAWENEAQLKTDFLDGSERVAATVYVNQRTEYRFSQDGTFTRQAVASLDRAESFIPDISEAMLAEYAAQNSYLLSLPVHGAWVVRNGTLTLNMVSVEAESGEQHPYTTIFPGEPATAAIPISREGDTLHIDTLLFTRSE